MKIVNYSHYKYPALSMYLLVVLKRKIREEKGWWKNCEDDAVHDDIINENGQLLVQQSLMIAVNELWYDT